MAKRAIVARLILEHLINYQSATSGNLTPIIWLAGAAQGTADAAFASRRRQWIGVGQSFSAMGVCPSQPPPNAAINCTLATRRVCSKVSTVRSLLSAVACTVTTSR